MSEQYPSQPPNEVLPMPPDMLEAGHRQVASAVESAEQHFPLQGQVQEAYLVRVGEASLPVLNYSEKPLTEETTASITEAYARVASVIGIDKTAGLNTQIAIVPGRNIGSTNAIGQADRQTRIIRIAEEAFSTNLLSERSQADYVKLAGAEANPAEVTLVHEFGHIIEFAATEDSATGGSDERLVKDFFQPKSLLEAPYRSTEAQDISKLPVSVFKEGDYVELNAAEAYGPDVTVTAPSDYARKSAGEYFAESFTAYAFNGELDQPLVDMVHSAIDTRLPGGMRQVGPIPQASVEQVFAHPT